MNSTGSLRHAGIKSSLQQDVNTPSVLDAASAVVDRAMASTSRALAAAGEGLIRISDYLVDKPEDDKAQDQKTTTVDNEKE